MKASGLRSLTLSTAAAICSPSATVIELPSTPDASLLCGEAGILLVAWRIAPSAGRADALFELVRKNVANEAQELMWGAPGTMLAAHALDAWTGEERWPEVRRESAETLLAGRDEDGLWAQRLHGKTHRFLGPVHGLAGNVHVLQRLEIRPQPVSHERMVVRDQHGDHVRHSTSHSRCRPLRPS